MPLPTLSKFHYLNNDFPAAEINVLCVCGTELWSNLSACTISMYIWGDVAFIFTMFGSEWILLYSCLKYIIRKMWKLTDIFTISVQFIFNVFYWKLIFPLFGLPSLAHLQLVKYISRRKRNSSEGEMTAVRNAKERRI